MFSNLLCIIYYPTNSFTILEPEDQEIGEFYVVQERRATDFEAPKLRKGSSGNEGSFTGNFTSILSIFLSVVV